MSSRVCITPEILTGGTRSPVSLAWEQPQPAGSWQDWIPVLPFPEWLSAPGKCPVVATGNSMTFHFSCYTSFLSSGGEKTLNLAFHLLVSKIMSAASCILSLCLTNTVFTTAPFLTWGPSRDIIWRWAHYNHYHCFGSSRHTQVQEKWMPSCLSFLR